MDDIELLAPVSYNTRNIPRVTYIADIATYMGDHDNDVANALVDLENQLSRYKFMFGSFQQQRDQLSKSIPELKVTIQTLQQIEQHELPMSFMYELTNSVYVRAEITRKDKVGVFLGSNVMVEYTMEEAMALLNKNVVGAEVQLKDLEQNLQFLKDQITAIEVSFSRVFNFDVQRRKADKSAK